MTEQKDLKPPYSSTGQADKLLDLFRRVTPQKIDSQFIATNEIATKVNAASVVKLAEWLGLVDENGVVRLEKINKLKLVGDARNEYIAELIRASYKDLFDRVNVETATRDDVVNYFVHTYTYGNTAAKQSAILFLHLCQTYGVTISEELKKKAYTPPSQPRAKPFLSRRAAASGFVPEDENDEQTKSQKAGSGLEIIVKSFGLEANPHTTVVVRSADELEAKLNSETSEFQAFLKYAKILLNQKKPNKEATAEEGGQP